MRIRLLCSLFCLICLFSVNAQKIAYDHNPAAGKFVAVNGIRLYYETYGSGMPLLMLHGNGGNMDAFSKQIPFFAKYFKVIAVDSRLQGRSGGSADTLSYDMMADDFCSLLDLLKIDSAFVLGWSDGGINGIIMAMHCPKKIKALAFTGANVVPDSTALPADMISEMKNFVETDTKASAKEKTLNRMMLLQPNIPYAALSAIHCPVLVMAGDHDIIKAEHTLKIFQSIKDAQLCIFPNANHGVCQQYPVLFNNTVLTFFNQYRKK